MINATFSTRNITIFRDLAFLGIDGNNIYLLTFFVNAKTFFNAKASAAKILGGLWALEWAWHVHVNKLALRTRLRN